MPRTMPTESRPESGWRELPTIVNESLVHQFRYWENHIKVGMRYRDELYILLQSYPIAKRLKACDLGCEYQRRGVDVCITVSKTTYSIWLNLKSLSELSLDSSQVIHPVRSANAE